MPKRLAVTDSSENSGRLRMRSTLKTRKDDGRGVVCPKSIVGQSVSMRISYGCARHAQSLRTVVRMSEMDLSRFDHAILDDNGERTINQEANRFDADPIRLTKSEIDALDAYDRVVIQARSGAKVVIEMIPDDPSRPSPVKIRDCEEVSR